MLYLSTGDNTSFQAGNISILIRFNAFQKFLLQLKCNLINYFYYSIYLHLVIVFYIFLLLVFIYQGTKKIKFSFTQCIVSLVIPSQLFPSQSFLISPSQLFPFLCKLQFVERINASYTHITGGHTHKVEIILSLLALKLIDVAVFLSFFN